MWAVLAWLSILAYKNKDTPVGGKLVSGEVRGPPLGGSLEGAGLEGQRPLWQPRGLPPRLLLGRRPGPEAWSPRLLPLPGWAAWSGDRPAHPAVLFCVSSHLPACPAPSPTHTQSTRAPAVKDIVEGHWAQYGRNVYSRYDYEGVDSDAAAKVVEHLESVIAAAKKSEHPSSCRAREAALTQRTDPCTPAPPLQNPKQTNPPPTPQATSLATMCWRRPTTLPTPTPLTAASRPGRASGLCSRTDPASSSGSRAPARREPPSGEDARCCAALHCPAATAARAGVRAASGKAQPEARPPQTQPRARKAALPVRLCTDLTVRYYCCGSTDHVWFCWPCARY
jgi:hypothetical protein